jgi:hypothetical protein
MKKPAMLGRRAGTQKTPALRKRRGSADDLDHRTMFIDFPEF